MPNGPRVTRELTMEQLGILVSGGMRNRGIMLAQTQYSYSVQTSGKYSSFYGIKVDSDGELGHTSLVVSYDTVKDIVQRSLILEGYQPYNVTINYEKNKLIVNFIATNQEVSK